MTPEQIFIIWASGFLVTAGYLNYMFDINPPKGSTIFKALFKLVSSALWPAFWVLIIIVSISLIGKEQHGS